MKHKRVTYAVMILALLKGGFVASLLAQTPFDAEFREEAQGIKEELRLFTDRSIYSVDEHISFVAEYAVSGLRSRNDWSSVLYVELITSDGMALVQRKYQLEGGRAGGTVQIPSETLTGNYYLKAYTRWMRNWGPQRFSYSALKIVNPFRSEVAAPSDMGEPSIHAESHAFKEGLVECSAGSPVYEGGQEVVFQLKRSPGALPDNLSCCITVAAEGAVDPAGGIYTYNPAQGPDSFEVRYLPDLVSGLSLSGTVVDPDQKPASFATLHFSLLGKEPDYFATMSDANGRFIISIPFDHKERMEFFVTPDQEGERDLEVRIDQEFDSRTMILPGVSFALTEKEMEVSRKIALNMQLSKAFGPALVSGEPVPQSPLNQGQRIPFYGTRAKHLLIDDYVRLPNLEEVFINLLPELQFYKKRGESRIRFLSSNESIGVYAPLVMIDNISIFDHESLLALSPEKIEQVDLINEIYLKGNVVFGGILAIHSRKGDMAGIDLPKGSYFFDFQSIQPDNFPAVPELFREDRVPDVRNTLFWATDVPLEPGQATELSFTAPDLPGEYVILVRGALPGGDLFSASTSFRVE